MDLPWCDYLFCMPCDSQEKTFSLVLHLKEKRKLHDLADELKFSDEFISVVQYIEALKYEECPKYD